MNPKYAFLEKVGRVYGKLDRKSMIKILKEYEAK